MRSDVLTAIEKERRRYYDAHGRYPDTMRIPPARDREIAAHATAQSGQSVEKLGQLWGMYLVVDPAITDVRAE